MIWDSEYCNAIPMGDSLGRMTNIPSNVQLRS